MDLRTNLSPEQCCKDLWSCSETPTIDLAGRHRAMFYEMQTGLYSVVTPRFNATNRKEGGSNSIVWHIVMVVTIIAT